MRDSILDEPALEPPSGVTPNFVDPPSLQNLYLTAAIPLLVVTSLAITARIYTKSVIIRKWMPEDCPFLPV